MPKRNMEMPEPPLTPCPFCGKIFPNHLSVYPHFSWCKDHKKYMKKHSLFDVKRLIRNKKWKKYFFPNKIKPQS
jgi:hypothetical protein